MLFSKSGINSQTLKLVVEIYHSFTRFMYVPGGWPWDLTINSRWWQLTDSLGKMDLNGHEINFESRDTTKWPGMLVHNYTSEMLRGIFI